MKSARANRYGGATTQRAILATLSFIAPVLLSQCGGTLREMGASARPNVTLSVQSMSFNSQVNPIQDVTLSNRGNAVLNISGITISPNFSEQDNCIPSLAAGASCDVGVIFAPSTTGNFTGTLSISDNAPGGVQTVSLTGTGATGNTTLTGHCVGGIVGVGGCAVGTAQDLAECSANQPAITPATESTMCGGSLLIDLSRICQARDFQGDLVRGHCEAQ